MTNRENLKNVLEDLNSNGGAPQEQLNTLLLTSIANSLAIIADSLTDGNDKIQEPFINKPCVSSGVCEHDKQKALDKIRAEIEERAKINQNINVDRAKTLCWCLDVIDKYKAESEETGNL